MFKLLFCRYWVIVIGLERDPYEVSDILHPDLTFHRIQGLTTSHLHAYSRHETSWISSTSLRILTRVSVQAAALNTCLTAGLLTGANQPYNAQSLSDTFVFILFS
jgi:hypothetical protein